MFGLPWAAVTFAPADAGMAICFEDYRDGTLKELYYSRYGGKSLHEQSHGESFLAYFQSFDQQGLYIMDEPEVALSPQRQLTFE